MLKIRLFTCKSISLYCTLPPLYYFWWIPFVILFNLLFKRTQTIHVVHLNVPFSLTTAFAHSLKWNCSRYSWDTTLIMNISSSWEVKQAGCHSSSYTQWYFISNIIFYQRLFSLSFFYNFFRFLNIEINSIFLLTEVVWWKYLK